MNEENNVVEILQLRALKKIKTESSFLQSLHSQFQSSSMFSNSIEITQECESKRKELVDFFNQKYLLTRRGIDQHHGIVGMYVVAQLEFEKFILRIPGTEIYMKALKEEIPIGNWQCNAGTLTPKGYFLLPMLEAGLLAKNFEKGSDLKNQYYDELIERLEISEDFEKLLNEESDKPLNCVELIDRIELSETDTILFHIKKHGYIVMAEILRLDKNGNYLNAINYLIKNNKIIKLAGLSCYVRFIQQKNIISSRYQLTCFDISFKSYVQINRLEEKYLTSSVCILLNTLPMISLAINEIKFLTSERVMEDGYYL